MSLTSSNKFITKYLDWTAHSNRASAIIMPSIMAAQDFIQLQHPQVQEFCFNQIRNTTFLYFDTYHGVGKPPYEVPTIDTDIAVQTLPRPIINPLGDKEIFARSIVATNLIDHATRTYFSKEEALSVGGNPDRLMFIKGRSGTRGEQVSCVKFSDLANTEVASNQIIQEEVSNPALYYGRKVVFRYYIIPFDRSIYISKHALVIVHGKEYDSTSIDYKIHVQHNGDDNEAIRIPLNKLPNGQEWFASIVNLTKALLPILDKTRRASSLFHYLIIGADAIPCMDGKTRIVELNIYPNLLNPAMRDAVYVPVMSSVMLKTVAGLDNGSWLKIE